MVSQATVKTNPSAPNPSGSSADMSQTTSCRPPSGPTSPESDPGVERNTAPVAGLVAVTERKGGFHDG